MTYPRIRPALAFAAGLTLLVLFLAPSAPPSIASQGVATKETALQRIQRSVLRINREASTPEGEAAVLKRLSLQFAISEDSLRARREEWGLEYGELAMVYGFARAARRQSATLPQQIVDLRRAGRDWKSIAREIGVSIDAVAARVRKSESLKARPS